MPASLPDPLRGALLGDALAMPVDGLSHQNVRFYYKGIKGFTASEQTGAPAGTGTRRTTALLAAHRSQPWHLDGAAAAAVAGVTGDASARADPDERVAARAIAHALQGAARRPFEAAAFWQALVDASARADAEEQGTGRIPDRLRALAHRLDRFPLDLVDACGGAGDRPDEAVPFALAMFARNPDLVEATLLSAINAGGDPATSGVVVGALLAARHGFEAFPDEWRDGLHAVRAASAA